MVSSFRFLLVLCLIICALSIPALKSSRKRIKEKLSGYNNFVTNGGSLIPLVNPNQLLTHYVIESQLSSGTVAQATARLAGTNIPSINFETSYAGFKTSVASYYTALKAAQQAGTAD